jgi:hypothetical protein
MLLPEQIESVSFLVAIIIAILWIVLGVVFQRLYAIAQ